jgi:hypothetical protein
VVDRESDSLAEGRANGRRRDETSFSFFFVDRFDAIITDGHITGGE